MNDKSVNKPLIVFSIVVSTVLLMLADAGSQVQLTTLADYLSTGIAYLFLYPFIVLWFKAIWNEVGYKIFNLPMLNYWQAAAVSIFLFLAIG